MLWCSGRVSIQQKGDFLVAMDSCVRAMPAMGLLGTGGPEAQAHLILGKVGTVACQALLAWLLILPCAWGKCCSSWPCTAPANPLPRLQPCFCCHLRPELHEGFKSSLLLKETQGLLSPFFNQWGLSSYIETWAVGLSQAGSKLAGKIINGVWSESSLLDVFLVCIHDSCVPKKTDFDGNSIISNSILKSLFKAAARQGVADELYINNSQHHHSSFCLCVWDIYCCALSSTWNKTWWKIISHFWKGVLLGLVRARIIIYSQKNTSRQCSSSYGSSVWWLLVCV